MYQIRNMLPLGHVTDPTVMSFSLYDFFPETGRVAFLAPAGEEGWGGIVSSRRTNKAVARRNTIGGEGGSEGERYVYGIDSGYLLLVVAKAA